MTLKDILNTNDRFAACNGIQLTEVKEGYARAEMTVGKDHLNAGGVCQGGALFTLADLALAAVMNSRGKLTFGIGNSISYLHSAKVGDHLVAEAVETLNHHKIPYCEVKIKNQQGELICAITGMSYRKDSPMPFDSLM
ncbi:MAG: hotdog fold thioesterase [Prevotella sp.]|jgi:acyl-CoA thioesterase|nr:hotdog fold thioesterase [Prevotella sp.]